MQINLVLKGNDKFMSTDIRLGIESESGMITTDYWENKMGLFLPFYVRKAQIEYDEPKRDKLIEQKHEINLKEPIFKGEYFESELLMSGDKGTGIRITSVSGRKKFRAYITVTLFLKNREVLTGFYLENTEGIRS